MVRTFSFSRSNRNELSVSYDTNEEDQIKVKRKSLDDGDAIMYLSVEEATELQLMLAKAVQGLS